MKKNIKKIIKKIILILCIFFVLQNNFAFAATESEFQNTIASYCWNFYQKTANNTAYDYGTAGKGVNVGHGNNYAREQAYKGITLSGTGHNRKGNPTGTLKNGYFFDCVGFVSFAIHHALGMGEENFTYFAVPIGCIDDDGTNGFKSHTYVGESDLKPGDILQNSHHVMIYVGDIDNSGKGSIVHCDGTGGPGGPANVKSSGWGVICEYLDMYEGDVLAYCRITPEALAGLDSSQFNTNGEALSVSSANGSIQNMSNFYYNGIPDGKYSVVKSIWDRLIDSLAEIFDYLIGIMTMVVRMVFVGWTAIFEMLITSTVKTVSGDGDIISVPVTSTDIESNENISIEKIVFNQISVFDVNFFNYNDQNNP